MSNTPTEKEYNDARAVTSAYEAAQKAAQEAARAAYAVPVKAMVESAEFRVVYDALVDMLANHSDDSFYGMPVGALHTISKNLATQVGVDMDAPVAGDAD